MSIDLSLVPESARDHILANPNAFLEKMYALAAGFVDPHQFVQMFEFELVIPEDVGENIKSILLDRQGPVDAREFDSDYFPIDHDPDESEGIFWEKENLNPHAFFQVEGMFPGTYVVKGYYPNALPRQDFLRLIEEQGEKAPDYDGLVHMKIFGEEELKKITQENKQFCWVSPCIPDQKNINMPALEFDGNDDAHSRWKMSFFNTAVDVFKFAQEYKKMHCWVTFKKVTETKPD